MQVIRWMCLGGINTRWKWQVKRVSLRAISSANCTATSQAGESAGLVCLCYPGNAGSRRNSRKRIMARASDYDVIHYHGHFPNVGKYIPRHINFVQTRHDQGGDCIINTRFRNGAMCSLLKPEDCASCVTPRPNIIQRTLSALAVRAHRHDVAQAFQRHKTIFVSDMLRRNFARVAGPGKWGIVVHNFVDAKNFRSVLSSAQISVSSE